MMTMSNTMDLFMEEHPLQSIPILAYSDTNSEYHMIC